MSFSVPQIESRTQFTPLPQHDNPIQVNNNDNNRHVVIEPCEEHFDWDSIVIMLRLALVGTLLIGLSLRQRPIEEPNSNSNPPKFFLDSIHVPNFKVSSNGKLSSTWYMTLTVSNVMNDSDINILRLDAAMCYKENRNDTLALKTSIIPQYAFQRVVFPLDGEETKRVHLKLNTTGLKKDQAIAQDMQRGVVMFSLSLRVIGEVVDEDGGVSHFTMYPKCNDLRVKFVGDKKKGEVATMIDTMPIECVGLVHWGWGGDKSEIHSRKTLEK